MTLDFEQRHTPMFAAWQKFVKEVRTERDGELVPFAANDRGYSMAMVSFYAGWRAANDARKEER